MSSTRLVGDVGGTNARFALLDSDNQLESTSTMRTDDFPSLAAAITTYLNDHDIDRVDTAEVAVATPVVGDAAVSYTHLTLTTKA